MTKQIYIFLTLLLFLTAAFNLVGIKWGIPTDKRAELVMGSSLKNAAFYSTMQKAREQLYKITGGSPLGRFKDNLTPVMAATGNDGVKNFVFNGNRDVLANFIRPYLLRTNHSDEQMVIASLAGMKPRHLDFNPRLFQYGGAYIYSLGAWYGVMHITGLISLHSNITSYFEDPTLMGNIFVAGRVFNIFLFMFTSIFIFLTVKECFDPATALVAVFLLAITPVFVLENHIQKPYCFSCFFAVAALYYSLKLLKNTPDAKTYIFAGIAAGLAIGSMPYNGLIIIAPLAVHILVFGKNIINKYLFIFLFAIAGSFILTNPYWILDYNGLSYELRSFGHARSVGEFKYFIDYLLTQVNHGYPYGMLLLSFTGLYFISRKDRKLAAVLSLTAIVPVIISAWMFRSSYDSIHNTRFLLPWTAVLIIPAARTITELFTNRRFILLSVLGLIALAPAIVTSTLLLRNFAIDSTANSTRNLAGSWINTNIPGDAVIGIFNMPEPSTVPPFRFDGRKIVIANNTVDQDYVIDMNVSKADRPIGKEYSLIKYFGTTRAYLFFGDNIGYSPVNAPICIYKKNT